jgi:hypothetical protein
MGTANKSICASIILMLLLVAIGPIVIDSASMGENSSQYIIGSSGVLPTGSSYIFFDNFDTGSLSSSWTVVNGTGNATGNAGVGTYTSKSGNYSMYTRHGVVTVTSKAFNLISYGKVQVGYWIRRGSSSFSEKPDTSEDLIVSYLNKTNN